MSRYREFRLLVFAIYAVIIIAAVAISYHLRGIDEKRFRRIAREECAGLIGGKP